VDIDFGSILSHFEITMPLCVTQIYRSAWSIGADYILKSNVSQAEFDKSIKLSRLLRSEGIPAVEYTNTAYGKQYVFAIDKYWCLMKIIEGTVFDPFIGEPKQNGVILGKTVAELHKALKRIEKRIEVHDADFFNELSAWIIPELEKSEISFADGVMERLQAFFERSYKALPRQLIHRDMHTSNLLFKNGTLSGYLDFDLSQRNVRVWDIVYLGCSLLVENYKDEARLNKWCDIFAGILQGYEEIMQLSEEEINAIPALFVFDEVLFTAFYSKTGQPEAVKNCMDMTNWLHENLPSILTTES